MRFKNKDRPNGESHRALEEATEHVLEVRSRSQEVTEVADALRDARKHNHFAEQLNILLGRRT